MHSGNSRSSLELLYNISRELASGLDLYTILNRMSNLAMSNVGAERASIVVLDDKAQPVEGVIVYGKRVQEHTTQPLLETVKKGLAGWVIRNRQAALVTNTSQDERWLRRPDDAPEQSGAKSAICVPILAHERLVGVLTLVHPVPGTFTQDHLDLLQAIADQAGTAIHNAQLYEKLNLAHQQYRELFDDSIDPILITNWEGQILEANRRAVQVIGGEYESLKGSPISNLDVSNEKKHGAGFKNLQSGDTITYETVLSTFTNTEIPVEVYIRQVNFNGAACLQWTLRDITTRKELDHLRDDLTAMIIHDLRAPLSNVETSLGILASMLPENEPTVESVMGVVSRSTDRLQRLIDSLLDIHRLEAGQKITNKTTADLNEMIRDAIEVVKPSADSKRQKIEMLAPPDLSDVIIDVDMIRRVLINLVDNAIKYAHANGDIQITAHEDEKFAYISVQDNGPGIQEEDHQRVFDKYTRLKDKGNAHGLGLGLAFCRLVIEAHGGKIWVQSREGEGANFTFSIPLESGIEPS